MTLCCWFRVCLEEIKVNKWAMKNAELPRGQRDQCPPLPLPYYSQSSFFSFFEPPFSWDDYGGEGAEKWKCEETKKGWVWESSLNWWGLLRADQDHGTEADRPMTLLFAFVGSRKKTQRQKSNDLLWLLFLLWKRFLPTALGSIFITSNRIVSKKHCSNYKAFLYPQVIKIAFLWTISLCNVMYESSN